MRSGLSVVMACVLVAGCSTARVAEVGNVNQGPPSPVEIPTEERESMLTRAERWIDRHGWVLLGIAAAGGGLFVHFSAQPGSQGDSSVGHCDRTIEPSCGIPGDTCANGWLVCHPASVHRGRRQ